MVSINTNLSSLIAQKSLANSTNRLNLAIERMSTGYKINHAGDNAANYSIATDMNSKIGSYEVAEDNVAMGLDMVSTANGALDEIGDRLARIRALIEQASNGTYGSQSIDAMKSEANAIASEITRIVENTEYNGIKLFEDCDSKFVNYVNRRETSSMVKLANVDESETLISGSYSISTAAELEKLATMTKAGNVGSGCEFVLAGDIDLSEYKTGTGWVTLGTSTNHFTATFDGNGYKITNLYVNAESNAAHGLFSHVRNATIKNLEISDCDITFTGFHTGALIGAALGNVTVDNCYATGTIVGSVATGGLIGSVGYGGSVGSLNITNSYADVTVTGSNYVGGLAGYLKEGSINNCGSAGTITGNNSDSVGAIVGFLRDECSYISCVSSANVSNNGTGGINTEEYTRVDNIYSAMGIYGEGKSLSLQTGIYGNLDSQLIIRPSFKKFDTSFLIEQLDNPNVLKTVDDYINRISSKQTELGAAQNRLESALESISVSYDNLVSSRSTLRDADIAKESSKYIQQQILQQAAATLLATANQSPSIALQLI